MKPVIVDGAHPNWEKELKIVLFARQDADLIHCSPSHLDECKRLALFAVMEIKMDEAARTLTFRNPVH